MSYQTNPILNRLKIAKGGKTSTFATTELKQTLDARLGFKLYLFLKVYLLLHGIRLLSAEVRATENSTKILTLVLTKLPQKNSRISKGKDHSFLKGLQSPLNVLRYQKSRFLLYLDIQKLSTQIFSVVNHKLLSQAGIAKPQTSSGINTSFFVGQQRQSAKLKAQLTGKKKASFLHRLRHTRLRRRSPFLAAFFPKHRSQFFGQKKERTVFSLLSQMQKKVAFFEKSFAFFGQQALHKGNMTSLKFITHLQHQLQKKKKALRRLSRIYVFLQKTNGRFRTKALVFPSQLLKKKRQRHGLHCLTQQSKLSPRSFFFFSRRQPKGLLAPKKRLVPGTPSLSVLKLWPRPKISQPLGKKGQPTKKKQRQEEVISLQELPKTRLLKKPYKISTQDNLFGIHLAQKKRPKRNPMYKKTPFKKERLFYRLSLQQNYDQFLSMSTQIKFKYLLQDLIAKYFAMPVRMKLSGPLIQFKNLDFQRLIFPQQQNPFGPSEEKPVLQHARWPDFEMESYLYVGQTTRHLKFGAGNHLLQATRFFKLSKSQFAQRNSYLAGKAEELKRQSQERLAFVYKVPYISALITTLSLFAKYLDPQPLADHLAKLVGQTKKHAQLLKLVATILRTFPLQRGLGYRIALIGRINGANKSKILYLRKLKRNRPRQTFAKKVNYATAHARALIGAFAIKIGVYL